MNDEDPVYVEDVWEPVTWARYEGKPVRKGVFIDWLKMLELAGVDDPPIFDEFAYSFVGEKVSVFVKKGNEWEKLWEGPINDVTEVIT